MLARFKLVNFAGVQPLCSTAPASGGFGGVVLFEGMCELVSGQDLQRALRAGVKEDDVSGDEGVGDSVDPMVPDPDDTFAELSCDSLCSSCLSILYRK